MKDLKALFLQDVQEVLNFVEKEEDPFIVFHWIISTSDRSIMQSGMAMGLVDLTELHSW